MMGRVDASVRRHDVACWHEREVFPCPLSHRSWSISGRNADIGMKARSNPMPCGATMDRG